MIKIILDLLLYQLKKVRHLLLLFFDNDYFDRWIRNMDDDFYSINKKEEQ